MPKKWEKYIDGVKDDAGVLAKEELKKLVNATSNDSDQFIREQGQKMEKYLTQLAAGALTKDQFKWYIEDIKDLTEMKKLEMSVAAKASTQRIIAGINKLMIDGLLKLL
jgi:hypothetical protein